LSAETYEAIISCCDHCSTEQAQQARVGAARETVIYRTILTRIVVEFSKGWGDIPDKSQMNFSRARTFYVSCFIGAAFVCVHAVQQEWPSSFPTRAGSQVLAQVFPQEGRRFQAFASDRSQYPTWKLPPGFENDVFTFVRIQFDSYGYGRGGGQGWQNDFPDCDWNLSVRLKQLTSLEVHPMGKILRLTDEELFDHPFIFMTNLGGMSLVESERHALRKYLLNGGFLMADDFWAAASWRHILSEMRQVLPGCEPIELRLEHPIFHVVYDFKNLPQVPSIRAWQRGLDYEDWHGPYDNGDTSPHFWGYHDRDGRLMALFCHNNDIADGWEREGEEIEYFQQYSVKYSYPLGINIITYAMSF
jgi:hypothetical protein